MQESPHVNIINKVFLSEMMGPRAFIHHTYVDQRISGCQNTTRICQVGKKDKL